MDKEPSAAQLWLWSGGFVAVGLALSRWKVWSPLLIWPISLGFGLASLGELFDPAVGPDILREAGWAYVIQSFGLAILVITAPIAIAAWAFVKQRRALANVQG